MARIAVAGFMHETNTFACVHTGMDAFIASDAWPGLLRGQALLDEVQGANIAIAGFIKQAKVLQHELAPLLWASANPSGLVSMRAYERIWSLLARELEQAMPIDALFLDLHGAMVAEHVDDGEGELLERIRAIVGPNIPIVASLDFHANISTRMVALSDALAVYRSYPHTDISATGRRAAILLQRLLDGKILHKAYHKLPFLIPMLWQCTLIEPMASLMRNVERYNDNISVEIAPGFPLADVYDCGPAVLAYGTDPVATEAAAQRLYDAILAQRDNFCGKLYTPEQAVSHALAAGNGKLIILADTNDNPGGGAASDTTDILHELVRQHAPSACFGLLCDPLAANAAHAAGSGKTIELALGSTASLVGRYTVEALGSGQFTGTGPFYLGCKMDLGPMARLRLGGIQILISSRKQQAADQAMFRHLGIEPAQQSILVLKSSVHFRADFAPLAREILIVAASGENIADLTQLHYQKLRPGVALPDAKC